MIPDHSQVQCAQKECIADTLGPLNVQNQTFLMSQNKVETADLTVIKENYKILMKR